MFAADPGRPRGARQQLQVDQLRHAALPELAARQRDPARRRRAHRALLHRLGHQAGHGGRAGAGRLPARAAVGRRTRWPPTRPSAGRWSPRCSGPRRPAWSGSRTWASTRTRSPSSSRSTSSPAAAGSPTATCGCGTRSSWPGWTPGSPATRSGAAWPPATCGRRCSSRCGCAASSWPTGSWSSAMDMYSAADGLPSDFHLVHLGGKALGGAGLVMTEMVCVSPEGQNLARLRRAVHGRSRRRPGGGSCRSCTTPRRPGSGSSSGTRAARDRRS